MQIPPQVLAATIETILAPYRGPGLVGLRSGRWDYGERIPGRTDATAHCCRQVQDVFSEGYH